jgi:hypothetical protein
MQIAQIVALLIVERDRLNRAIEALHDGGKRRGRPPKRDTSSASSTTRPTRKRRTFTVAQRKEQAERMRAFWAKRKQTRKMKAK